MPERENFTFNPGELGIVSTEELIDAGENFLDSDPNDIKFIRQESPEDKAAKEAEEKKKKEEELKKKEKPEIKEVITKPKEVDADDLLNEKEDDEEEVKLDDKGVAIPAEKKDSDFTTIAKELLAQGVFTEDLDEEGLVVPIKDDLTAEEFLDSFRGQTKKQAADIIDKFIGQFGDEYKDMFENVFVRGVPPTDYLSRYAKIENIKGIDLTEESNQEKVVRELYRTEGRSPEYIEKRVTQLKNYNDLLDESTEAQRILADREEKAMLKAGADKQVEITRKQQIKNEYINNVNKIISDKFKAKEFDGIPVDKKFADQTFNYITKEKYQTADKQLLTEFDKDILDLGRPENHELKVKVAMLIQLAKEDPQLTKLAKKAISKETNTLFNGLKKSTPPTKAEEKKEVVKDNKEEPASWFA